MVVMFGGVVGVASDAGMHPWKPTTKRSWPRVRRSRLRVKASLCRTARADLVEGVLIATTVVGGVGAVAVVGGGGGGSGVAAGVAAAVAVAGGVRRGEEGGVGIGSGFDILSIDGRISVSREVWLLASDLVLTVVMVAW